MRACSLPAQLARGWPNYTLLMPVPRNTGSKASPEGKKEGD